MPLNTLRLNHQPSSHPNERIVFIKAIPRPASEKDDHDRAELVLKAIAAQCLPIMKAHHLSVTTLEEYEPNPEFIGRNFNNGEIIQLVIRSKSGAWIPLSMIQMVMMHELAHNTHMNHGKGFWQTRNLYADEMRQLWSKHYTGEGLWGQGRSLSTVQEAIGNNFIRSEEAAALPLCGGTYRSRRKKRKAKTEDLNWKEKRDKRIEKKFGKNGATLGEDEDKRLALEINGRGSIGTKPRVAQSKRGRELRAAAALARFSSNKREVAEVESASRGDEDDTESEEYEELDAGQEDVCDHQGRRIVDRNGQGMIRICEADDHDDENETNNVKHEMEEIANLSSTQIQSKQDFHKIEESDTASEDGSDAATISNPSPCPVVVVQSSSTEKKPVQNTDTMKRAHAAGYLQKPKSDLASLSVAGPLSSECPICSLENDSIRSTCSACSHVLDVEKDPWHWQCRSETCQASNYINAGDCGVCGICGTRRPKPSSEAGHNERKTSNADYSGHIAYL